MITVGNKKLGAKGEYIGRPSVLGNPFASKNSNIAKVKTNSPAESVALYKEWFYQQIKTNKVMQDELNRLYRIAKQQDLTLVCWCKDKNGNNPCHGDVIKEFLEQYL